MGAVLTMYVSQATGKPLNPKRPNPKPSALKPPKPPKPYTLNPIPNPKPSILIRRRWCGFLRNFLVSGLQCPAAGVPAAVCGFRFLGLGFGFRVQGSGLRLSGSTNAGKLNPRP